jgi:hypothetical protein
LYMRAATFKLQLEWSGKKVETTMD